jgi:hypothetical protein
MASTSDPGGEYNVLRIDLIDKLGERDWFIECTGKFYVDVARNWRCAVNPNDGRLGDAWDLWTADVVRTAIYGIERSETITRDFASASRSLDHYKHASILAFWLRHMVPINQMWALNDESRYADIKIYNLSAPQKFFLAYGAELTALLFGFYLAYNYHIQNHEADLVKRGRPWPKGQREELIRSTKFPHRFIYEFPILLRSKNISPHSIYMTYCSLFDRLAPPI